MGDAPAKSWLCTSKKAEKEAAWAADFSSCVWCFSLKHPRTLPTLNQLMVGDAPAKSWLCTSKKAEKEAAWAAIYLCLNYV